MAETALNDEVADNIRAYYAYFGNLDQACTAYGVSRKTFVKEYGKPDLAECTLQEKGRRLRTLRQHALEDPKTNVGLMRILDPGFARISPPHTMEVSVGNPEVKPIEA